MDTDKSNGSGRVAMLMRNVRTGVFGTLFVIQKKVHASTSRSIVASLIRWAQMISFALGHAFHGWHEPTIRPVKFVLGLTTVHGYWSYFTPSVYLGLYYFALSWVTIFICLTIWAMTSFVRNQFAALWPLKLLRAIGTFSASVLYIPLFTLLMSGFQCDDAESNSFWVDAGYSCFQGGHLAQTAIAAVLSIAFFVLCSLFSLVFYDSNSLSANIVAKAHGRVDFLFLCIKTILVITVDIFPTMLPSGILVALLIGAGVIWTMSSLFFMPYFDHRWNSWQSAQSTSFLFAAVCVLLTEMYAGHDAGVTLYLGVPICAILGIYLSNARSNWILQTPALRLTSPYEIELKARYLLHLGMWGHHTSRTGLTSIASLFANTASGTTTSSSSAVLSSTSTSSSPSSSHHASHQDEHKHLAASSGSHASSASASSGVSSSHDIEAGGGSSSANNGAGGSSPPAFAMDDAEGSDDVEVRMQAARRIIPQSVQNEVHSILRSAASRFRASAILHVFFSRYYLLQGNRHMQMSHLLQAERRHPPLDVAFLVFQARKLAEDNTGSGGQMSALNRVTFEKYSGDARKFVLRAAMRQLAFWTELLDAQPDLSRLHGLSSEMNDAISSAEHCFMELFAINPQSLAVMRLYAAFNSYVCCNPDKAGVLLQEAERIEDQRSKDHRVEGGGTNLHIMSESTLDIMADNTAVVTVGGLQRNLGIILSANAQTTKLFGYSRLQLERRPFFSLMPHPLSTVMEGMLRQYVATGEGKIASTHVVFGQNKIGHIVPLLLCMRETPADEGPPSFIALMRELRTSDHHIILTSDFHITAASSGGFELLGIDASSLAGLEVAITDFVLEWDAVIHDLVTTRGSSFCFDRGSAHRSGVPCEDDDEEDEQYDEDGNMVLSSSLMNNKNNKMINDRRAQYRAEDYDNDNAALLYGAEMEQDENLMMSQQQQQQGRRGSVNSLRGPNNNTNIGGTSNSSSSTSDKTYVRGHLQTLPLPEGGHFFVLGFQRITESDSYGIAKAAKRRRESLASLGLGATGMMMSASGSNASASSNADLNLLSFASASRPQQQQQQQQHSTSFRQPPLTPGLVRANSGYGSKHNLVSATTTTGMVNLLSHVKPQMASSGSFLLRNNNGNTAAPSALYSTKKSDPAMHVFDNGAVTGNRNVAGIRQQPPPPQQRVHNSNSTGSRSNMNTGADIYRHDVDSYNATDFHINDGNNSDVAAGDDEDEDEFEMVGIREDLSQPTPAPTIIIATSGKAQFAARPPTPPHHSEPSSGASSVAGLAREDSVIGITVGEAVEEDGAGSVGSTNNIEEDDEDDDGSVRGILGSLGVMDASSSLDNLVPSLENKNIASAAPSTVTSSTNFTASASTNVVSATTSAMRRSSSGGTGADTKRKVRMSESPPITHDHHHHQGHSEVVTTTTTTTNASRGGYNALASTGSSSASAPLASSSQEKFSNKNSNNNAKTRPPPVPSGRRVSANGIAPSGNTFASSSFGQSNNNNNIMSSEQRNINKGVELSERQSQGSTASYSRKTMNRLRRVLADSSLSLLRGLYFLRIVGIFITLLSIALAVSVTLVMKEEFSMYRDNLVYTSMGADRIISVFNMVLNAMDMHYAAKGWDDMTPEIEATVRQQLYNNVTHFTYVHREMYRMVQGQPLATTYTLPVITTTRYDTPNAGDVGSYEVMNMFQAGLSLAANAALMSHLPLANLSNDRHPTVAFINVNGVSGGSTHEAIHHSLELGYEMSLVTRGLVEKNAIGVYAGMSALLCVIAVCVFIPILLSVESAKDAIVKRFVYLPQLVRLSLHKQAEKRLRALRRNYSEDDEDDDDDIPDDDEGGGIGNGMNGTFGMNSDLDDDTDDVDWDKVLATINNASSGPAQSKAAMVAKANAAHGIVVPPKTGTSGSHNNNNIVDLSSSSKASSSCSASLRQFLHNINPFRCCVTMAQQKRALPAYQKGMGSIVGLFAKFLGPLISLFLFFTVIFILSSQTLELALRLSSAQVAAANRVACVRELYMDARHMISVTEDRPFFLTQRDTSYDTSLCVRYHQELMLFGLHGAVDRGDYSSFTPIMETGNSPYLSDSANEDLYLTQYSNACPFIVDHTASTTDLEGCEAFSNGILKQGLHVTVNEYLRRAELLLDTRVRSVILKETVLGGGKKSNPDGIGYEIDALKYDYKKDECGASMSCWVPYVSTGGGGGEDPSPSPNFAYFGDVDLNWDPIANNVTGRYSIKDVLMSPDMMWLRQADALFITPAFASFQTLYEKAGLTAIDSFLRFLNVFVSTFIVFFVLFMFLVFMPQVKSTNSDIQKKRGMLLFLPAQVVRNVRSIRQLVDEILADDAGGGARSASAAARAGFTSKSGGAREEGGSGGGGGGGGGSINHTPANEGPAMTKIRSFLGNDIVKKAAAVEV